MSIINNALSGSLAAQAGVNAASQNIANLQTKGYTRQGVLLGAVAGRNGVMSAGDGVEVMGLIRFSDSYKNQQMWRGASEQGLYTQTQPYLTQLERIMGDDLSSISNGVDSFFKALNAAGVDPTSTPLRQQIVTAADAMSQHFNSINSVMNNQLLSVHQQRDAIIPQVNTTLASIAALNGKITSAGATGTNVSTLIDARDEAIDSLASQMSLEVIDQPDGSRNVALKTGQPLVIGNIAGSMTSALDVSNQQVLSLTFTTSTFIVDNVSVGGQLGGLGGYERDVLRPMQQSVQGIAQQLAIDINAQLAAGITMAGAAGTPLFVFNASSASVLTLTPGFTADKLALAKVGGGQGDSTNLQALIKIKNNPVTLPGMSPMPIGDADTQLVGKLAITSQKNKALLQTAVTVRNQAVADWKATSAVNKDEEGVNLLEFQNMFQANMKVIAAANQMFDATLAMMS
ncbi:flagellar hook-associated protein FlgK [Janthinobacterium fluminis]|uniref:Flagellar hook-associated protein 1 n=1 Tax=Janthinobacterium fluminis TaxID=2987524 RepID=A0ABT5JWC1_9BURK|nr:flagellar hook-associated protein FlgK [Janthinobacterium fluminis]MDC8756475.1 flagellar hook-associated protein FlgK [Janthinobacterium fluminis]